MDFWPCLTPPTVLFNNIPVQRSTFQKHLGVYLDEKLNFNTDITEKIGKASKGIGVIKKLFKSLPRNALLTFINHLLDSTQQGIVIVRSQTSVDLERYCKMGRVCSIIRNFTKLNFLKL